MKLIKTFIGLVLFILGCGGPPVGAVTLKELEQDDQLTPDRFARYFTDFEFQLREKVQPPEHFLASRSGDCDDYATLAADILKAKGYTTRLIVVFMPKDIHVVCYVAETRSYLDFNSRACTTPTVQCGGALSDIADQVAKSFRASWHCVSEFTLKDGIRQFVYTDFPQVKPVQEALKPSKDSEKAVALPSLVNQETAPAKGG